MWNPSSLTRGQSCLGNRKSYPLGHEGSPKFKTLIWKVSIEAIIFLAWTIFSTSNSILKLGRGVCPCLNLSIFPKTCRLEDKLLSWPQKTLQDLSLFCPQPQQTPLYLCSNPSHSYHSFATSSLHNFTRYLLLRAPPSTWKFLQISFRLSLSSVRSSQVAQVVKKPPINTGDKKDEGWIPGLGRSPGGGHGNPLQYSCLENPMERETWRLQSMGSQRVQHDWSGLTQCTLLWRLSWQSLQGNVSNVSPLCSPEPWLAWSFFCFHTWSPTTWGSSWPCSQVKPLPWCDEWHVAGCWFKFPDLGTHSACPTTSEV